MVACDQCRWWPPRSLRRRPSICTMIGKSGHGAPATRSGTLARAVFAAMLVQYAAGGAFLPFAKFYLDDLGLSAVEVTWVFAGSAAVGATLPVFWGVLADRFVSPTRLLATMNVLGCLAMLVLSHLTAFSAVAVAYAAVAAFLFPTFAVLNAVAYHHVAYPQRHFGRLRAWGSLGWALPAGGVWLWLSVSEDSSVAFLPSVAAAVMAVMAGISLCLPGVPPPARTGAGQRGGVYWRELRSLLSRPPFLCMLVAVFLSFSSFSIWFYYSPAYLEQLGFERRWIGPIQTIGVLAEIPLCMVLWRAIARWGYRGTLLLGAGALFARQLLFATCSVPTLLVVSYLLVAVSVVFYLVAASLAIETMAEPEVRATAQTLSALCGPGLGQIAGHVVVGWIAGGPGADLRDAFWCGTVTACVGMGVIVLGVTEADFKRGQHRI